MSRNGYQYSTSPRKLEPEYRPHKQKRKLKVVEDLPRQEVKISKEQKKKQLKITLAVIAIFGLLLTISYRNSQINEEFNKMQNLKINGAKKVELIKENDDNTKEYRIIPEKDYDIRKTIFSDLSKENITIFELKKPEITLEEAFMDLIKKNEKEKEEKEKKAEEEKKQKEEQKKQEKIEKKEQKQEMKKEKKEQKEKKKNKDKKEKGGNE